MSKTIRLIRPAHRETTDLLPLRIKQLEAAGFRVIHNDTKALGTWPRSAGSVAQRSQELNAALLDPACDIIWAVRGGFGVADLLPLIPWDKLKSSKPKWIVGFSDISMLHAALYTRLGWTGLHAPMPGGTLWGKDGYMDDVAATVDILKGEKQQGSISISLVKAPANSPPGYPLSGKLFGGNFAVLSSLIGTSYLPKSFPNGILFLEDVSEPWGRVMRFIAHWREAGLLTELKAVVLGSFKGLADGVSDTDSDPQFLADAVARFGGVPVFSTIEFGHTSPNHPLVVGAEAEISGAYLDWSL